MKLITQDLTSHEAVSLVQEYSTNICAELQLSTIYKNMLTKNMSILKLKRFDQCIILCLTHNERLVSQGNTLHRWRNR